MTKFLSDQNPDYRNVLSELQRFIQPGQYQPRKTSPLASSDLFGTGGQYHCETQGKGSLAVEQDQTVVHEKVSSNQPTRFVNAFSGNFNTSGGKMIQGGNFSSGGGPMNF